MVSVNRSIAAACIMLGLFAGFGCNLHTPLADRHAYLPPHVQLPEGFSPLVGQYDPNNPEDSYNGWPRYIVGDRDNMIMAYVPAQKVVIGGGLDDDERPARRVTVNHFYIDVHEVTNSQFDRFRKDAVGCCKNRLETYRSKDRPWVESGAYHTYPSEYCFRWHDKQKLYPETSLNFWFWRGQTPADIDFYLDYWTPGLNNDHPVRAVSWWEAWYYSKWACKVLPTEAQWEVAARGDDQRIYPWGNEEQVSHTRYLCNHRTGREDFDDYEYAAPVMSFAAGVSPFGAYNMAGNVWEWCLDYYDPGRYAYPSEQDPPSELQRGPKAFGDRNYPNPLEKYIREERVGPLRGDQRVVRGGSFADPIERCRVESRRGLRPDVHEYNVGFRCVLPLPPVTDGRQG
ncbi:MAG: formylglycine-generating enzyme family protein [Phycisphaerales bacterium]|nr:formylglycine-generating enzyme family protein [Phycisphaerales bacterium]